MSLLQQSETHAFRLYHDYTETREGIDRYVNVVRRGSTVTNPSAAVLDTGEKLRVENSRRRHYEGKIDIGEPVQADSEAVVFDSRPSEGAVGPYANRGDLRRSRPLRNDR